METPFAPRTTHIVGRRDLIDAMRAAISDKSGRSHVLYFIGHGGIGKTRLLEEVAVIQEEAEQRSRAFRRTGIIDLYHAEYHSPGGVRQAIANGLDPDNEYFQDYRLARDEFERKRQEGIAVRELEKLHDQLDELFQQEYRVLAEKQRLVICFDTLELIQYESDVVQNICEVQSTDTLIKNWLLARAAHFPNTVFLLAGRPRPRVQADLEQGFTEAGCVVELFELTALTQADTADYLKMMGERRPDLAEILTPEVQERVFYITQGRPIYLTLLVDLMLSGDTLSQIFPAPGESSEPLTEDFVAQKLVDHLRNLPDPFGQMIEFLIHARKGLNADLLRHLVGKSWSGTYLQRSLQMMHELAFVKYRPQPAQLFLHDEVYDLFDRYFLNDPRYGREYEPIAQYYRQRLEAATSLREREDLTVARLYYELQVYPDAGFHQCYARWDDDAIRNYETGFDMRLRDEALRFIDRYTKPESPFYDSRVAQRIDRAAVDRDSAVRWVKRYLARGDFEKARRVAEKLRYSTEPAFEWGQINAPLYQADLLLVWGEALVHAGAPEEVSRAPFDQAREILKDEEGWDENQRWRRARILGRIHHYLGYLYRTCGRYGLALEEYGLALPHFNEADIWDEMANTMTNKAYLLALLGRVNLALYHIKQALEIRQDIGRKAQIALSRNTRGIIHTLQDHPMWGEQDCREALRIFRELQETRGIGMACIGLGFALRKRGDQWKLDVYSQKKAQKFFRESDVHLKRAAEIFSTQVREPIRLWEAYNELGSLYCDWGWLTRRRKSGFKTALQQYDQSIEHQNAALQIAQEYNLQFPITDSYDDLAQVYSDRSFLLAQMSQREQARESREIAESYLDRVLELVPQAFHLMPGEGFRQAPEPGESYWLSLGKGYQWRGVWAFRDLEQGWVLNQDREEALSKATQQLIVAVTYFQRYWAASFALEHTLDYIISFLQSAGVSVDWAHAQVRSVANEYRVNLDVLDKVIANTLTL